MLERRWKGLLQWEEIKDLKPGDRLHLDDHSPMGGAGSWTVTRDGNGRSVGVRGDDDLHPLLPYEGPWSVTPNHPLAIYVEPTVPDGMSQPWAMWVATAGEGVLIERDDPYAGLEIGPALEGDL